MWNIEDKTGFDMESKNNRGQINIEQDFGKRIFDLAIQEENKIFVDIGTWNGLGSTRCFIEAMKINKNCILYSIENNSEKIEHAKLFWKDIIDNNQIEVHFLNGSLISNDKIDRWIIESDINLSEIQKYWLQIDKTNTKNVISLDCQNIDILLIDGSDYSGFLEFSLLKDISKYILLDDVIGLKNEITRKYLLESKEFELVFEDLKSRSGYSIFKKIEEK